MITTQPSADRPGSAAAIRPPVKWYGGKHYLARRIVALLPAHRTYVEPFGGGASVLLNKPPSPVEVYNDLDASLANLFAVLRDRPAEFQRVMTLTPYSEVEFNAARGNDHGADPVERARRFCVRCRQSFGGQGKSFSATKHRVRRGMADVVSGYLSAVDRELPAIVERLRRVQILSRPALDVILGWDSPDTLFYCDPPYVPETRTSADVYAFEMSARDHRELLAALLDCKGKVVLSGYACALYDTTLTGWRQVTFDLPNNAAGGKHKARRTEMVWMNFGPGVRPGPDRQED